MKEYKNIKDLSKKIDRVLLSSSKEEKLELLKEMKAFEKRAINLYRSDYLEKTK